MSKIDPKIFHAYDVRGVYPGEINEAAVFDIAAALVEFLRKKFKTSEPRIVVGRDSRLSSPKLFDFFVQGALSRGAAIIDVGLVPTDALYFASNHLGVEAGAMITASHNPSRYNGIKIIVKGQRMLSGDWGWPQIKKLVLKENFGPTTVARKKIRRYNITPDYSKRVLSLIDKRRIKKMKIIIDAGNGVGSIMVKNVIKELPFNVVYLNCRLDGNSPSHPPDPLIKENIRELCQEVIRRKADFGLALDGDGDRTIFVDEKGKSVSSDLIIVLFARYYLSKRPGSAIVYNLTCSKTVPEMIRHYGGKPVKTRTGHSFMKEACKKYQAIFGGEIAGHFYFRDFYYAECSGLALALMAEILSMAGKPLSLLVKEVKHYYRLGEINFKIKDCQAAMKRAANLYSSGKQKWLDGLTVEFKDWWFNLRPSNTEPLLRLVIEANDKKTAEKRLKEIKNAIKGK